MKKWTTKLHRFPFGPQIGDVYVHDDRPMNPFKPIDDHLVQIIDRKNGWVQIKHISKASHYESTQEWSIKIFLSQYKFLKVNK